MKNSHRRPELSTSKAASSSAVKTSANSTVKISPARIAAFQILKRVATEEAFANNLLSSSLTDRLSLEDRALAQEIVMGVIRYQLRIDYFLTQLIGNKLTRFDIEVLISLRMGFYQIHLLSRIPLHAAINESVNLTKYAGKTSASGLVNAVLRKVAKLNVTDQSISLSGNIAEPNMQLATRLSHPQWLIKNWQDHYDLNWITDLCNTNNHAAPISFRLNYLLGRSEQILAQLDQHGLEYQASEIVAQGYRVVRGDIGKLILLAEQGLLHIQDEASQLVAKMVMAQENMRILDACSAPGGKTTATAEDMKNSGQIVALEKHYLRIKTIKELTTRLKINNIELVCGDATQLPFNDDMKFDRVLVDAPCSGTGTLRHNPEIKWRLTSDKIKELSRLQLEILTSCAKVVKPGGRLIYSTCSLEYEENEGVINKFLSNNDQFHIVVPPAPARLITADNFVRTWPQRDGCDGFFAALLQRH